MRIWITKERDIIILQDGERFLFLPTGRLPEIRRVSGICKSLVEILGISAEKEIIDVSVVPVPGRLSRRRRIMAVVWETCPNTRYLERKRQIELDGISCAGVPDALRSDRWLSTNYIYALSLLEADKVELIETTELESYGYRLNLEVKDEE